LFTLRPFSYTQPSHASSLMYNHSYHQCINPSRQRRAASAPPRPGAPRAPPPRTPRRPPPPCGREERRSALKPMVTRIPSLPHLPFPSLTSPRPAPPAGTPAAPRAPPRRSPPPAPAPAGAAQRCSGRARAGGRSRRRWPRLPRSVGPPAAAPRRPPPFFRAWIDRSWVSPSVSPSVSRPPQTAMASNALTLTSSPCKWPEPVPRTWKPPPPFAGAAAASSRSRASISASASTSRQTLITWVDRMALLGEQQG